MLLYVDFTKFDANANKRHFRTITANWPFQTFPDLKFYQTRTQALSSMRRRGRKILAGTGHVNTVIFVGKWKGSFLPRWKSLGTRFYVRKLSPLANRLHRKARKESSCPTIVVHNHSYRNPKVIHSSLHYSHTNNRKSEKIPV